MSCTLSWEIKKMKCNYDWSSLCPPKYILARYFVYKIHHLSIPVPRYRALHSSHWMAIIFAQMVIVVGTISNYYRVSKYSTFPFWPIPIHYSKYSTSYPDTCHAYMYGTWDHGIKWQGGDCRTLSLSSHCSISRLYNVVPVYGITCDTV